MKSVPLAHPHLAERSLDKPIRRGQGLVVTSRDIISLFTQHGLECYVTGGSPRDWLTGSESLDIDISISGSIADAKDLLMQAYPDPSAFLWQYNDFGLIGWGDSEAVHIDINILRDFRDAHAEIFEPQLDFSHDYQTRDFSINCLYYSIRVKVIYDPNGHASDDLRDRILRVNADPVTFASNHSLSYRIAKFMMKGYSLHESCHSYLQSYLAKDLKEFTDQEFRSFRSAQIEAKGLSARLFMENLETLSKRHQCLDVFRQRSILFQD